MPEDKESRSKRSNEANKADEPDRGTRAKPGRGEEDIDRADVAGATVEGLGEDATSEEKE